MYKPAVPLRTPVNVLESLLNKCYTTPACRKHSPHRSYTTEPSASNITNGVTDVAVLGGGITGLASAFFLNQQLPEARITLFESTSRLGGWLRSKQIDVGNGKVIFEQGPRNLRPNLPNGLVTLNLVCLEDLMDSKLLIVAIRFMISGSRTEFL